MKRLHFLHLLICLYISKPDILRDLYDLQDIRQQNILKFNLNFRTGISDMMVSALLQSINWQFKTSKKLAQ